MKPSGAVHLTLPIGIVVQRSPGVTRWVRWVWRPVALLPGAAPAEWAVLRQDGDHTEFHAATLPLTLWSSDTEAYRAALSEREPHVYVVMRETEEGEPPLEVVLVTASPYEAQDHTDAGEDIVEKVPMTAGLIAWVREFVEAHHEDEVFVKRQRDKKRIDLVEDGKGDARIQQLSDVYRAPRPRAKSGRLH